MALTEKLTAIGDAIRGKTGSTEALSLDQMAAEIAGIETSGGMTLLYRAEITEPVSLISVDVLEEWKNYDLWLIVPKQLTFSTEEWFCFKCKVDKITYQIYIGSSGSVGHKVFNLEHSELLFRFTDGYAYFKESGKAPLEVNSSLVTKITFSPYYAENTIDSGSFDIYGVML